MNRAVDFQCEIRAIGFGLVIGQPNEPSVIDELQKRGLLSQVQAGVSLSRLSVCVWHGARLHKQTGRGHFRIQNRRRIDSSGAVPFCVTHAVFVLVCSLCSLLSPMYAFCEFRNVKISDLD